MRVITTSNFEYKFPEIESSIKSAQLISFDVQSSGIVPECTKKAGFPSPEELYLHIRRNIRKCIIVQFGLTAFAYNSTSQKYTASCYTFLAYPRSVASVKKDFELNTSLFAFLAHNGFDFNKIIFKGLNYLNEVEEAELDRDLTGLASGDQLDSGDRGLSHEEETEIKIHCTRVSQWETAAKEEEELVLDIADISNKLFLFLLNKEIQRRFHTVWTFKDGHDTVKVRRVSDITRTILEGKEATQGCYETEVMNSFVGLSRIFKLIKDHKRPVVGNSPLVALMTMFQEMYRPLPASYSSFKEQLHALFPHIYDAQHISYEMEEIYGLKHDELTVLRTYFNTGEGAKLPKCSPAIELSRTTSEAPQTIGQEPGWHSYYTGSCFIRMAHFMAKLSDVTFDDGETVLVSQILASGVKKYKNCIHIAPANIDYICIDSTDPKPGESQKLVVNWSLRRLKQQVMRDIKLLVRNSIMFDSMNENSAVVRVNSVEAAAALAQDFHYQVDVEEKKDWKRLLIIGGAVGMTGLSVILLIKACAK